jgi:outer membrane lipoprotein carrier protein
MPLFRTAFILLMLSLCNTVSAKTINDYLGHVKTISAKFEQFVFNESTGEPDKTSGRIYVASPDKFRLTYDKPYVQVYVADGKRLWSYDQDLEQVTIKPQKNMLANSPAIVLSDPANLDKAYTVKAQGIKGNVDWFYLTPRSPDSGFDHVRLGFAGNNLYAMELYDSFGQKTELHFTELQYNAKIPADTFTFTPPKGVDVIGDTDNE